MRETGEDARVAERRGHEESGRMQRTEIHGIEVEIAETFFERTRGLLGRGGIEPGKGLWICNAIHMLFMRFPIDAVFLDKNLNIVKVVKNIRPWRFFVWGGWRADSVIETAAGSVKFE